MEFQPNKFPIVDKDEQKVIVGKLKMLETWAGLIDMMRESLTRQLVVNGNATEEDVFKEENLEEKKRHLGIKGLDGDVDGELDLTEDDIKCIETNFDVSKMETIKEI